MKEQVWIVTISSATSIFPDLYQVGDDGHPYFFADHFETDGAFAHFDLSAAQLPEHYGNVPPHLTIPARDVLWAVRLDRKKLPAGFVRS